MFEFTIHFMLILYHIYGYEFEFNINLKCAVM